MGLCINYAPDYSLRQEREWKMCRLFASCGPKLIKEFACHFKQTPKHTCCIDFVPGLVSNTLSPGGQLCIFFMGRKETSRLPGLSSWPLGLFSGHAPPLATPTSQATPTPPSSIASAWLKKVLEHWYYLLFALVEVYVCQSLLSIQLECCLLYNGKNPTCCLGQFCRQPPKSWPLGNVTLEL